MWVPSALSAADVSVADLLNLTEGEIQPVVSGVDLAAQRAAFFKDFRSADSFLQRATERMGRAFGDAGQFVTGYDGKAVRGAYGAWYPSSGKMWISPKVKGWFRGLKAESKLRLGKVRLTETTLRNTRQGLHVLLHENIHAFGEPAGFVDRIRRDFDYVSGVGRTMEEGFTDLYTRRHLDDFIRAFGFPKELEEQLLETKLQNWAYEDLVKRVDGMTADLAKLAGRGQDELLDRIAKEGHVAPIHDYEREIVSRAIQEGRLPQWSEESNSYFIAVDYIDAQIREKLGGYGSKGAISIYDKVTAQFAKAKQLGYWQD